MSNPVPARELFNARVNWIALVDAGANKEPFRVVKNQSGETPMLDLEKAFEVKKNAGATIVFVGVSKDADLDKAKAVIEKAGFKIDAQEAAKSGTIFKQAETIPADTVLFKAGENIVVGISGMMIEKSVTLAKGLQPISWEETDFGTLMAQQGAMPLISVAKQILGEAIYNIMGQAEGPAEAATAVGKAADGFKAYVLGVLKNIPKTAFKLDELLHVGKAEHPAVEALKTDEEKVEKADDKADEKITKADDKADDTAVEKADDNKGSEGGDTVEKTEADAGGDKSVVKQEPTDETDKPDPLKGLTEQISALTGLVQATLSKVEKGEGDTANALKTLGARIEEVAGVATKTQKAVKGAVRGGIDADDIDLSGTAVRKAAEAQAEGDWNFDTAHGRFN